MMYQIYLHVRMFLKISLLLVGIYCKLGGVYCFRLFEKYAINK